MIAALIVGIAPTPAGGVRSPRARAQCAAPAVRQSIPASGEAHVPTTTLLRARYEPPARHEGEPVRIAVDAERPTAIEAWFDAAESTLYARAPLAAGRLHTLWWPGLRARGGIERGTGQAVSFVVADLGSDGPPSLDAIDAVRWDVRRTPDPCVRDRVERYEFDLTLSGLHDETPGLLEVYVFATDGPGVRRDGTPRLLDVARPVASNVRVSLPREEALGRVCFVAAALDASGQWSPTTAPACTTTLRPPFFAGCAVLPFARGRPGARRLSAVLVLVLFWIGVGRRRGAIVPHPERSMLQPIDDGTTYPIITRFFGGMAAASTCRV